MILKDNLTKEEFENFSKKCKYNHFLQSYDWGETCKVRKQVPVYIGLFNDENNLVAAALLMRKNTPLHMTYFYSPRGILIDYNNKELLKEFTVKLKEYLQKQNAIYFRMDPAISYEDIDEEANPIKDGNNNYELFDYLISLGYKHRGFTKLFGTNQPRYTFRLNTKRTIEEIEQDINKSFMKTVKRSYNYDLEVLDSYDNETFYKLMTDIANRDNFNGNSKDFYNEFDKNFSNDNNVHYVTIKIYPDKIIKKAKDELEPLQKDLEEGNISPKKIADTKNLITRLQKDIDMFKDYENKYPDGLISLILICPKTTNAMWTLYIGNNDIATYTFSVNRAYYEAIKYASENNLDFLDFYGTVGEPHTTVRNYAGIHEYKRKMGGTYTEFIGEFDLVLKPFWYKILPTLLKIYRKLKK